MIIDISSKETLYSYNLYHIVKAFFPNAEIRQKVDETKVPKGLQGAGFAMIVTGIMALAFIGFSGILSIQ